ncbi:MAG: ATP-binding cassette domain-containing protein [Bacteriovoracaceae bacterium]|jgi:cell division transport system ATP-binding protein|nr:hypothetical protein [Halobacteriovoraceae bacterium]MDP7320283.1 ATP-binding cassette domain-containing protein [Bacteriovoracaceae bacterium]
MKDIFQRKKENYRFRDQFLYHLDNVDVKFRHCHALKGITLTVNPGEILFVTGKSGAGKTTLLNLLSGDLHPSRGRVLGVEQGDRFVSQVFQDLRLFDNKSCEENIWYAYDAKLYKNRNEFHADMIELASVLGMKDKLSLKIEQANGGLKQKVAMVRALMTRPNILIADEPTAALDKESSIKLFDVLNFYNVKRKLTVVWASHNRDLVKQFPGKIVHLENGKLIYSGHACFI